jgi:hypothetical protein
MRPEKLTSKLIIIMGIIIGIGLCLSSVPVVAQTLAGIIHHWPANGDAIDLAGGNNGTLHNGATFGAGSDGLAFDLTGSGDYVSMAQPVSFAEGEDFTVSLWMKMVAPSPNWGGLFATRRSDFYGFVLLVNANGAIGLDGRCDNATFDFGGYSAPTTMGEWHHVAAAFDWTSDQVAFYVDGNLVNQSSLTACNGFTLSDKLYLGANSALNPNFEFNGLIDEVQVYGRYLSGSEILTLFNESPVPNANSTWGNIKNIYR